MDFMFEDEQHPVINCIKRFYNDRDVEIRYWDCNICTDNIYEKRVMEDLRHGFKLLAPFVYNFDGVRVLYCSKAEDDIDVNEILYNDSSDYVFVETRAKTRWVEHPKYNHFIQMVNFLNNNFFVHFYTKKIHINNGKRKRTHI